MNAEVDVRLRASDYCAQIAVGLSNVERCGIIAVEAENWGGWQSWVGRAAVARRGRARRDSVRKQLLQLCLCHADIINTKFFGINRVGVDGRCGDRLREYICNTVARVGEPPAHLRKNRFSEMV